MPDLSQSVYLITIMALPFLFAVTLHEAGHAYVASMLGDQTAKQQGRLSLNPFVHLDPVGTVLIPLFAIFTGFPFLIGYAKPVPIQPRYFKKLKRDMILVALAGPFGNLVVAIFFAYAMRIGLVFGAESGDWVMQTAFYGIFLNCLFMVFNLLPIPPLDGSGVVEQFLPHDMAVKYRSIAPFGFFILIAIIIVARDIIIVPTYFMTALILSLAGVSP